MISLPVTREYKMSFLWRIWFGLIILFCLAMLWTSIRFLIAFVTDGLGSFLNGAIFSFMLIGALSMASFYLWYCLDIFFGKLTIRDDRLEYRSLFKKSTLLFTEINGFKSSLTPTGFGFNFIIITILPYDNIEKRKISMSQYISHQTELLTWLSENFKLTSGRLHVDY